MRKYKMWWLTSDVSESVSLDAMREHFPDEGCREVWEDVTGYQTIVAMSADLDMSHLFEYVDHRTILEILCDPKEVSYSETMAVLPDNSVVMRYTYRISTSDFNDTYEKYYVKEQTYA